MRNIAASAVAEGSYIEARCIEPLGLPKPALSRLQKSTQHENGGQSHPKLTPPPNPIISLEIYRYGTV
jgi:hypothetical protein